MLVSQVHILRSPNAPLNPYFFRHERFRTYCELPNNERNAIEFDHSILDRSSTGDNKRGKKWREDDYYKVVCIALWTQVPNLNLGTSLQNETLFVVVELLHMHECNGKLNTRPKL